MQKKPSVQETDVLHFYDEADPKITKFFREGEEFITDDELRKRKKKRFLNAMFYNRLTTMVDQINEQKSAE